MVACNIQNLQICPVWCLELLTVDSVQKPIDSDFYCVLLVLRTTRQIVLASVNQPPSLYPSISLVVLDNLCGLSPLANCIDQATAACRRSWCQFCGLRVSRGQRNGFL
jgi:hypothetical protein